MKLIWNEKRDLTFENPSLAYIKNTMRYQRDYNKRET